MPMSLSERFVDALERYFGPWRGNGRDGGIRVKQQIAEWLDRQNVPKWVLDEVFLNLKETRRIAPVNTIGIADLDAELDRYYDTPRTPPTALLEAPAFDDVECSETEFEQRKTVAEKLRELAEMVTDDTRRSELLRQRADSDL